MVLSSLFQKRVRNFSVNVLLLENTNDYRVKYDSWGIGDGWTVKTWETDNEWGRPELRLISPRHISTCFSYEGAYKNISTNTHTNTDETLPSGTKELRNMSPLRWVSVGVAWMMWCPVFQGGRLLCCLLWIVKVRGKDKNYIWILLFIMNRKSES